MKNELLTIGPFTVYGYGAMIALGILAAYFVAEFRAKKLKMDAEQVAYITIWCVIGGFIGAKLLFWITEWKSILGKPSFLMQTLSDGFVVYGGIIGGILIGFLYSRVKKLEFWEYFDLIMPSIALAQGFGRIGCLLAGCCYGYETDSVCSITFQTSDFAPNGVALVPTQIYSSLLDFIHFGILLLISKHKKADGVVGAFYLIFYSIGRFVLEFFRGDVERGNVGIFSTSQFIGIFMAIVGVMILGQRYRQSSRKKFKF